MLIDNRIMEFAISKCKRDGSISEMDIGDIIGNAQSYCNPKLTDPIDHDVAMHTLLVIYNTLNLTSSARDFFLRRLVINDIETHDILGKVEG